MKILIASDFHLDDNPLNEYRWSIFPWLYEQIDKYEIEHVFILGDLTEKKDGHDAKLVNRLVDGLMMLTKLANVDIVSGNHDSVDRMKPYFMFLNYLLDLTYHYEPSIFEVEKEKWLILPYSDNPVEEWKKFGSFEGHDKLFIHQDIVGAKTSNYYKMEKGLDRNCFRKARQVFSGHIHVPQEIGNIVYVGAPYPVDFGDDYEGRILIVDGDKVTQLKYESIQKIMLDIYSMDELRKVKVREDDQVKVRLHLRRVDIPDVERYKTQIRDWCVLNEVVLCSLELVLMVDGKVDDGVGDQKIFKQLNDKEVVKEFAERELLDNNYVDIGMEIVNERGV